MNKEENASAQGIIHENREIFRKVDLKNLTNAAEHSADAVEDAEPGYVKIYRYPKIHEKEVKEQVETMLEDDTIRESTSPWNSPLWIYQQQDALGKTTGDLMIFL